MLRIHNISRADEGKYTCFAENYLGKANSTGHLSVRGTQKHGRTHTYTGKNTHICTRTHMACTFLHTCTHTLAHWNTCVVLRQSHSSPTLLLHFLLPLSSPDATKITLAPSNADINQEENVTLQCHASHDPTMDLTFTWALNGALLDLEDPGGPYHRVEGVS